MDDWQTLRHYVYPNMEEADVAQVVFVLLACKAPTLSICLVDIDVPDPTPTLVNPPRGNLGSLEPTPQLAGALGTHPAASCDPPETGGWTGGRQEVYRSL